MKDLRYSTIMWLIAMIAGLLLLVGPNTTLAQSGSGSASSEMFGDGRDGDLVVGSGQTVYVDNVSSAVGDNSPSGQRALAVSNTSPFSVGDEVLIIQTQGTGAGLYEFGTIERKDVRSFTMQQPLSNTYTVVGANNRAQVLKVPHYRNITVQGSGILGTPAWDGATGGILAFRANGTVTVNGTIPLNGAVGLNHEQSTANINQNGGGFRGGGNDEYSVPDNHGDGPSSQAEGTAGAGGAVTTSANANGGGGGHKAASGGGGGNGSAGTNGGVGSDPAGGTGGAGGSSGGNVDLTTMVFGGGGGGGAGLGGNDAGGYGGNGGGIVFITATTLTMGGSSAIASNGGIGGTGGGSSASGGGGGAGGSILLKAQTATLGTALITATGGAGGGRNGVGASGGAGGNGRVRIEYCDTLSGSTNPSASTRKLNCNVAPVATNDTHDVDEDNTLTVPAPGVLGNDTDADEDALTAELVSGPSHGTLTLNSDGSFTYTPAANYFGSDSFTYKASDGKGGEDTATVSITVNPINDPPVVSAQSVTTNEDVAKNITLAASDVEGDTLSYTVVDAPEHGTLSGTGANRTYTPDADYFGPDSFTFKANDGTADSNTATVDVTVSTIDDRPNAVDDGSTSSPKVTTDEDSATGQIDVLSNDSGLGDGPVSVSVETQGTKGTATVNANNTLTYTPNADANGSDSFVYEVCDADGTPDCDTATVWIAVNPINDRPVAVKDSATTRQNTAVTIRVLDNDSDADGDALTVSGVTAKSSKGGKVITNGTTVRYKPKSGFRGRDSFTYTISDGNGGTAAAIVNVRVT